MRIRNKKTGEIVDLVGIVTLEKRIFLRIENKIGIFKVEINSLSELTDNWEDYEN